MESIRSLGARIKEDEGRAADLKTEREELEREIKACRDGILLGRWQAVQSLLEEYETLAQQLEECEEYSGFDAADSDELVTLQQMAQQDRREINKLRMKIEETSRDMEDAKRTVLESADKGARLARRRFNGSLGLAAASVCAAAGLAILAAVLENTALNMFSVPLLALFIYSIARAARVKVLLKEQQEAERELENEQQYMKKYRNDLLVLLSEREGELARKEERISAILHKCGAAGMEEYRDKAGGYERYNRLKSRLEQVKMLLEIRLDGESREALEQRAKAVMAAGAGPIAKSAAEMAAADAAGAGGVPGDAPDAAYASDGVPGYAPDAAYASDGVPGDAPDAAYASDGVPGYAPDAADAPEGVPGDAPDAAYASDGVPGYAPDAADAPEGVPGDAPDAAYASDGVPGYAPDAADAPEGVPGDAPDAADASCRVQHGGTAGFGREALEDREKRLRHIREEEARLLAGIEKAKGGMEALERTIAGLPEMEEELSGARDRLKRLKAEREAAEIALETMREASASVHREFAPALNRKVNEITSRITGGRYTDLQVTGDLDVLVTAPETGRRIQAEVLSGGTVDQLYFALRIAASDLVSGGRKLPLFLDDSFVQYDCDRLENVMRYLLEEARERQIMIFTCSGREKEVAEALGGVYNYLVID